MNGGSRDPSLKRAALKVERENSPDLYLKFTEKIQQHLFRITADFSEGGRSSGR
jgi:hypothetical protein